VTSKTTHDDGHAYADVLRRLGLRARDRTWFLLQSRYRGWPARHALDTIRLAPNRELIADLTAERGEGVDLLEKGLGCTLPE